MRNVKTPPDIPLAQGQFTFVLNYKNKKMQTVKIEPFKLIGITIRTTNVNEKSTIDIANLWQKFISENTLIEIPNKVSTEVYSLYTDYESDHTEAYTTIIGCKVKNLDSIPNGMIGKTFEGGTYVKTSIKGDLMQGIIIKHWSKIFEMDLERTFIADFEIFGEKAQDPSNAEIDFYVGVKKNYNL